MKEIINFIESNVNGKTLFTKELVYELEHGALQGVYSDQISFSNLKYSQSGFQLDMFIVSNEKIWLIGQEGQREELRKDFSGVSLFRFELAERKSTNGITGSFRFISASGKNVAAEAIISGIYDVRLENDVLKLSEDQVLYRDQPVQDGRFKPVAFQSQHRFYNEDGKLHYEYDGKCFDVDPKTMKRSGSPDTFPPFISIEK
ncbi:hypothetical protein GCM10008910_02090 [Faecalicatena orotica]|uniref:Uncharacterized protein n=1 Tax=Faecalicatena orotica TaxID=1544 RepID=A0A2Y9BET7_9FIRM|nr:hypothetical protein [Faecalicatena orotica]PWJ28657.1 hypothetical protein A8806_108172 [Faecalicatena orotica]SSA56479.1 hypothetical protein SAMN05216536_108172 [Faecalicatena orotica]